MTTTILPITERPAPPPSDLELLAAELGETVREDQGSDELLDQAGIKNRWTLNKIPTRTVYDRQGRPREVPGHPSSLKMALANGFAMSCPLCHGQHQTVDPNACSAREKRAFWVCPVCAKAGRVKRIWDDFDEDVEVQTNDPLQQTFGPDATDAATQLERSRQRIAIKRRAHLACYHVDEARAEGIDVSQYGR